MYLRQGSGGCGFESHAECVFYLIFDFWDEGGCFAMGNFGIGGWMDGWIEGFSFAVNKLGFCGLGLGWTRSTQVLVRFNY